MKQNNEKYLAALQKADYGNLASLEEMILTSCMYAQLDWLRNLLISQGRLADLPAPHGKLWDPIERLTLTAQESLVAAQRLLPELEALTEQM